MAVVENYLGGYSHAVVLLPGDQAVSGGIGGSFCAIGRVSLAKNAGHMVGNCLEANA
jgi:hypothetical protein